MRINTNISSMNAHRQLGIGNTNASRSMERLSSGFRINRAGDDAAGLAISEKMRGQIRGLNQAARNAQDGISLIQTAEGALQETHSILQRMRELAVQSANGTSQDAVDRENINQEVTRLKEEIDRISNSVNFNGTKLLNGTLSADGSMKVGGNVLGLSTMIGGKNSIAATSFKVNGATADSGTGAVNITGPETKALNGMTFKFELGSKDMDPTAYVDSEKNEIVIRLSADQTKNSNAALQGAIGNAIKGSNLVHKDSFGDYYFKSTGDPFAEYGTDFSFSGFDGLTQAQDDLITADQIAELNQSLTYELGNAGVSAQEGFAQKFQVGDKVGNTLEISFNQMVDAEGKEINDFLNGYTFRVTAGSKSFIETSVDDHKKVITVGLSTVQQMNTAEHIETALKGITINGHVLDGTNVSFSVTGSGDLRTGEVGLDTRKFVNAGTVSQDGLTFQIGADGAGDMRVKLNVEDMSTEGLKISNISMATQKGATEAISRLDDAINTVSLQRSNLGALQNRLEHTIKNLNTSSENISAAESRIRDVDMAKEMMEFTKNNILQQAATAMLAQANMAPQSVLQLLG